MIVYFYITPYDVSRLMAIKAPVLTEEKPIEYTTTQSAAPDFVMVSLHAEDFVYFNECGVLTNITTLLV